MTSNIVRFQALLNRRYVRESEACEYLDRLENEHWDRRTILREAIIALRIMRESGWQPQEDIGEVQLTKEIQQMLKTMGHLVKKMSSIDMSGARYTDGSLVGEELTNEWNEFEKGAAQILGDPIFFEEDENE